MLINTIDSLMIYNYSAVLMLLFTLMILGLSYLTIKYIYVKKTGNYNRNKKYRSNVAFSISVLSALAIFFTNHIRTVELNEDDIVRVISNSNLTTTQYESILKRNINNGENGLNYEKISNELKLGNVDIIEYKKEPAVKIDVEPIVDNELDSEIEVEPENKDIINVKAISFD